MKTLSIIIPVYNEEDTVEKLLKKIINQNLPGWRKEIIVVNDGSVDRSSQILSKFRNSSLGIQIYNQEHQGMGQALLTGIRKATGEAVIFQDADLEYNPSDLPDLIKPFKNPKVSVVYGSRYLKGSKKGYFIYYLGASFFTFLINKLYNCHLSDAFTGYKVFRSTVIKKIRSNYRGFEFNVDITSQILKSGIVIHEVPISYYPRTFSEGKKIDPLVGLFDLIIILKNRFF
ncbi:glycosyltransferase family 2 protein [Candidatus Woesebacteria bacterium]|nr:glycosyltransferase family 2 protein [Candidatus Woesebacteria bacterium]